MDRIARASTGERRLVFEAAAQQLGAGAVQGRQLERTNAFLADAFVPKLRATLSESLGTEASVRCGVEEETVYFDYPHSYESAGTLDTIKLEIGPWRHGCPPRRRR